MRVDWEREIEEGGGGGGVGFVEIQMEREGLYIMGLTVSDIFNLVLSANGTVAMESYGPPLLLA